MGNFCSSKQEYSHLYPHLPQLFASISSSPSSSSLSSPLSPFSPPPPSGPMVIPSLFDLCLQQLCLSLLDSSSYSELSRRRSSLRMTDEQLFMLQHWMASQIQGRRQRALSLSSKESPELLPQSLPIPPPIFSPHSLPPTLPQVSRSVRYNSNSRSLSAHQSAQQSARRSSLSVSGVVPRDAMILHQMQSSVSTPTSPVQRAHSCDESGEADMSMTMIQAGGGRSVSSYAGNAAQWMWEKGRRRSWFAGSTGPALSPTSSHAPFLTPPLHSLSFPSSSRVRLPDSLIELIFHRLVQQRLLTLSTLHLFWSAPLSRIDLKEYEGVTDGWMEVLLAGWMVGREGAWRRGREEKEDEVEEESDEEDEDEEEEEQKAEKSFTAPTPSAAMDIRRPPIPEDEWSISSSPLLSPRPVSRPLYGSSVTTTRSSSFSTTPQQPPPLSISPVIKSLPLASLPPPSLSLASHPSLPLRYLDLTKCDLVTDRPLYSLLYAPLLSHLNVSGCTQISDALLSTILPSLSNLSYLNLNNCHSVTNITLAALHSSSRLHHLHLDCTAIDDNGLLSISHLTRLRTLSVGANGKRVSDVGLSWLPACFSLRSLSIPHTAVRSPAIFQSLQRLRTLDISGLKLSAPPSLPLRLTSLTMQQAEVRELPSSLLHWGLGTLDAGFCKMGGGKLAAGLERLARCREEGEVEAVLGGEEEEDEEEEEEICYEMDRVPSPSPSPPSSQPLSTPQSMPLLPLSSPTTGSPPSLSLSSGPLLHTLNLESSEADNRLLPVLASFPHLTSLNLCDTSVDQDGLSHLTPLITLRSLNLSGNHLNNSSLSYLSSLTNLTSLHLDANSLSDAGLVHLSTLSSLTHLDLFECSITDAGIAHLTPLTSLQSLECCSTKLTNACLQHLLPLPLTSLNLCRNPGIDDRATPVLSQMRRLRHLNLSHTGVTGRGLEGFGGCLSLKTLSLFGCKVGGVGEKVRASLPLGLQVGLDQWVVAAVEEGEGEARGVGGRRGSQQ